MATHANITSFLKLVAAAACVAAVALVSPVQAKPWPVLTPALADYWEHKDGPIPARYNPDTHAMPSNLVVKVLPHEKYAAFCKRVKYGCTITPTAKNSLTYFYIFIDADKVPPALRSRVLRHEKAHVLGWLH